MLWLPLGLCTLLVAVGILIRRIKLTLPASVDWPESEDPDVALEWAGSLQDANRILGSDAVLFGQENRKLVIQQQHLDWAFIGLYVVFFITVAIIQKPEHAALFWTLLGFAAAAGVFDFAEDAHIIRLCHGKQGSPRLVSQAKWIFFFSAVGVAAWGFAYPSAGTLGAQLFTLAIAAVAGATAIIGIVATVRRQFEDLLAAVRVAAGLIGAIALLPLILHYGLSVGRALEFATLMRVPVLTGLALIALPLVARYTSASSLLLGFFDVTPLGNCFVALAAAFAAGIVSDNARVIYLGSFARIPLGPTPTTPAWIWFAITGALSLPVIVLAVHFADQQNKGNLTRRVISAAGALAVALGLQFLAVRAVREIDLPWLTRTTSPVPLLDGYFPANEHLTAAFFFLAALTVYIWLGVYGAKRLGKSATVPALCALLMLFMLACSSLSALTFFLDKWHIPVLLVLLLVGLITAQSSQSDHLYNLLPCEPGTTAAPTPIETVRATRASCNRRIIVVAANGGGIQAAAWAAQVLEGLAKAAPGLFPQSVRLISSVSGGSVGNACYIYRQAEGSSAEDAAVAAAKSSLDEVAWGFAWPDLFRAVLPWLSGNLIGRGRALEKAWIRNCGKDEDGGSNLDKPLSRWNAKVASGDLPAVVLNATICETGERLLLGTTRFGDTLTDRGLVDARILHQGKDVAAVTAARLSASFPYVTPASRSDLPGPQVHVVDGGYYDNYGMSTLVEWLDEALTGDEDSDECAVSQVLVLQIHGAPVGGNQSPQGKVQNRGWFYQILAPPTTLNAVRGTGQLAHNDIELAMLQQKWRQRGVAIHSLTFEFPDEHAPLSWHLTPQQSERIVACWETDPAMQSRAAQVVQFLQGSKTFQCDCPSCRPDYPPAR